MRYRVTVYYREPLYAQTRGIEAKEQRGTFEVSALNERDAKLTAIEAFREAARRSSVNWEREIVRVVVHKRG